MPEFLLREFYTLYGRGSEIGALFANLETTQQPLAIGDLDRQARARVQPM